MLVVVKMLDEPATMSLGPPPPGSHRMYAIAFNLDTEALRRYASATSSNNAYGEIRDILAAAGFRWQQGSLYFGAPLVVDAVACIVAARRLATDLSWFSECVRDIRMLRIEETNDLGPNISAPF